jgi:hypothetical protein
MGISIVRGFKAHEGAHALPISVEIEVHSGWGKSWLARIAAPATEQDRKFGVARTFVDRESQSLSRAGNGTLHYEITEPGLYEASGVYRSFTPWRVIFRVNEDGSVVQVANDQDDNLRSTYRKLFAEKPAEVQQ